MLTRGCSGQPQAGTGSIASAVVDGTRGDGTGRPRPRELQQGGVGWQRRLLHAVQAQRARAGVRPGGGYYSPFVQLSGDGGLGTDWMNFFAEPDPTSPSSFLPDFGHCDILRATGGINGYPNPKGGASVADIADKIVKQVRNLLA